MIGNSTWNCMLQVIVVLFSIVRRDDFRKLLVYISARLNESEVSQIRYLRDVPDANDKINGLDTLRALENRGEFSALLTSPLIKLLEDIVRCDLAHYIKSGYQGRFPGEKEV